MRNVFVVHCAVFVECSDGVLYIICGKWRENDLEWWDCEFVDFEILKLIDNIDNYSLIVVKH